MSTTKGGDGAQGSGPSVFGIAGTPRDPASSRVVQDPAERARQTLTLLLAGRRVDRELVAALHRYWVPVASMHLGSGGDQDPRWRVLRQLLARLTGTLQRLDSRHANVVPLVRQLREVEADWQRLAPGLVPVAAAREALMTAIADQVQAAVNQVRAGGRESGATTGRHPSATHHPEPPPAWRNVFAESARRKKLECDAIGQLHAGDRIALRDEHGRMTTYRVERIEIQGDHVLVRNERTSWQAVMGRARMAQQLADGSLVILG